MRLIILGTSRDDKGSQLEELTKRILEHQGFKDIVPNEQVSGASELDVTAQKEVQAGMGTVTIPVICECKAHGTPIVMTDWLKFIGKLTIARKSNSNTIGLMLALSGANGTVMGSYHTDFNDDKTTQLIANDDIVSLISGIYAIPDETVIRDKFQNLPVPSLLNIDLLYYHSQIRWILTFADGCYTICDLNGAPQKKVDISELLPMIEKSNEFTQMNYIDLWESVELVGQLNNINSVLLTILANDGKEKLDDIRPHIVITSTGLPVEEEQLLSAINQNPFVLYDQNNRTVSLKPDNQICYADFYRFVLLQGAPTELIGSDLYQSHIDEKLLEEIWMIQYNFKMDEDSTSKVLFVLKHSPSALLYALCPDQLYRGYQAISGFNEMSTLYRSHFMTEITNRFIENYNDPNLNQLYLNQFKISKVSLSTTIDVLVDTSVETLSAKRNYALAKIEGSDQVAMIITKDNVKSSINTNTDS